MVERLDVAIAPRIMRPAANRFLVSGLRPNHQVN